MASIQTELGHDTEAALLFSVIGSPAKSSRLLTAISRRSESG
jgi:hypothetical protein